jgi:hypothetical protein
MMLDPSKRFATLVLAAGVVVLLVAIATGEHMGNGVMGDAVAKASAAPQITVTAAPNQATSPYGPDWKSSQALAAAPDPRFPDPRVPPVALPTPAPAAASTATAKPLHTYNPNVPIWRQTALPPPLPTGSPAKP